MYYTNLAWYRTSQRGRVQPSSSRGSTTRDLKQNRKKKKKKERKENERKARRLELIENARVSSHSINRQMDYRVLSTTPSSLPHFHLRRGRREKRVTPLIKLVSERLSHTVDGRKFFFFKRKLNARWEMFVWNLFENSSLLDLNERSWISEIKETCVVPDRCRKGRRL